MKDHSIIKSEIDKYSQVILIGEDHGNERIFWDAKDLIEVERLLSSSLKYIRSIL